MKNAGCGETHPPPGSATSKRRGRSQVFCQSPLGEARAKWKTRAAGKPTPTRVRRLKAARAKISSLPKPSWRSESEVENEGRRETHPHQGPPSKSGVRENKFFAKLSYKKAGEREE